MAVINTNSGALRAQNASRIATNMQATSMERLSTGKRINSAKDDAAGLAIANSMTAQIRGMNQGIRNANDGMSMLQSAEGALGEVTNILQRVRELTVQAGSETYSQTDRTSMQAEVTALTAQVSDIMANTTFNGVKLFLNASPTADSLDAGTPPQTIPGNAVALDVQTGANAADKVAVRIKAINLRAITGGAEIAANAGSAPTPTAPAVKKQAYEAAIAPLDITGPDGTKARTALGTLDTAIGAVSSARADLGGSQSRLESVMNVQTSNATNLADARSRIEDTDYSQETTALAKAQILSQASQAMLAQANQSTQAVMNLLRQ
ncbi:flagellin [Sphingomonas montana]|uniref:flagellin N-terminal helical domain-containing protein n=1 Tax=Sphingomonas montana TaxID=1843236 RepID=UPI00096DD139|nr:flagellin [Sphingomonas montana]